MFLSIHLQLTINPAGCWPSNLCPEDLLGQFPKPLSLGKLWPAETPRLTWRSLHGWKWMYFFSLLYDITKKDSRRIIFWLFGCLLGKISLQNAALSNLTSTKCWILQISWPFFSSSWNWAGNGPAMEWQIVVITCFHHHCRAIDVNFLPRNQSKKGISFRFKPPEFFGPHKTTRWFPTVFISPLPGEMIQFD